MEPASPNTLAVLCGLGIGAVVGAAALLSNFCALGAVADILFAKDWRRMRAWMMAAGVAVLGTQTLDALGLIHIDRVLAPYLLWLPTLIGGTCFGFGMALAGGCINRALVRIGAGSLKSLVTVLVVAFAAAATAVGVLAPVNQALARVGSLDLMVAPEAFHRLIAVVPALNAEAVRWIVTVSAAELIGFCLKDSWFRASRGHLAAGVIIGAMIPAAWLASDSATALNFVTPFGGLAAALTKDSAMPLFGLATIVGVPLGAFVAALTTRNLALETFADRADARRNMIGAALMGFGGTLALGDTFGQGLSGLSTFSLSAMLTVAGILFGCLWGIRSFEAEGVWRGLALAFRRGV